MSRSHPSNSLTPTELAPFARLEAVAKRGARTYAGVGKALGEIRNRHLYRGTHRSFGTYLRDLWGAARVGDPLVQPAAPADVQSASSTESAASASVRDPWCDAIAKAFDQALQTLDADDLADLDIRLTAGERRHWATPTRESSVDAGSVAEAVRDELLPALRWLLTQSTGTIADAAHRLETHAADVDDHARAQLADDVRTLDEELATLKALLVGAVDWDSDLERLLGGEIPPLNEDTGEER
jgi:hypothetical protein